MSSTRLRLSWRTLSLLGLSALLLTIFLSFRNAGLYASVFADEYTYSLYSRLVPRSDSIIPSYLFLGLFSVTRQCGPAFLDCARALNVLLLVSSMPFIYSVARSVASPWVSWGVTLLAMIGPYNTYTAYFMPECMYYLGFWIVAWFVLRVKISREWVLGACIGALVGVLTLVKMHGIFLFPGLACFYLWGYLVKARAFTFARAAQFAAATLGVFFAVRFGLGFLLAGRPGLHLLGAVYGDVASTAKHGSAEVLEQVGQMAMGHSLALLVMFAVPIGLALAPRGKRALESVPILERFLLSMLLPLLTIVVLFTVSIAGAGPYEYLTRVHMRYYNFLFPLFSILVAGHFSSWLEQPLARQRWAQQWIFAVLAVPMAWALFDHLAFLSPVLPDCPELRGLTVNTRAFMVVGGVGLISLVVAAFRPRYGVALYFLVYTPLFVGVTAHWANSELRDRRHPDVYDRGAEFVRRYIGQETDQLLVAGPQIAGLYRAHFVLDDPGTHVVALEEGVPLAPADIPAGTRWILYIGEHPTETPPVADTAGQGFFLVKVGP